MIGNYVGGRWIVNFLHYENLIDAWVNIIRDKRVGTSISIHCSNNNSDVGEIIPDLERKNLVTKLLKSYYLPW